MLYATGASTTIVQSLKRITGEKIEPANLFFDGRKKDVDARFVLAAGFLYGKQLAIMNADEIANTLQINLIDTITLCDRILNCAPEARICVIGSQSAIKGSFDTMYGIAKAGLHHYVETKRLTHGQQLVAVAPWIIKDSGMTERRKDQDNLNVLRDAHPKGRFISALEIAKLIEFLLYVDLGYITNTVIDLHGGRV